MSVLSIAKTYWVTVQKRSAFKSTFDCKQTFKHWLHHKYIESMAAFAFNSNTSFTNILKNSLNTKCFKWYLSYTSFATKPKEMPKDNTLLLQKLRENRKNNAKKSAKNKVPSNLFQLTVLGNGSEGNPNALYVNTDRNSYLFNCGEGTQRLANEHKYNVFSFIIWFN